MKDIEILMRLLVAVAIVVLLAGGCKTVTVTTEVKPDGSCIRTIVAEPDSEDVVNTFWPLPSDTSWTITTIRQKKENGEKGDYVYKATKQFQDVNDLSLEFDLRRATNDSLAISCPIVFEKFHRWFYTYFRYEETYRAYNQFSITPISEVMSEEEQALIYDEDHSEAEDKYESWLMEKNALLEFYFSFVKEAENLNDPSLTRSIIDEHKTQILGAVEDADGDSAKEVVPAALEEIAKILGTNSVKKLEGPLLPPTRRLFQKLFLMLDMDDDEFHNSVVMPGQLVASNAQITKGSKAIWEIKAKDWRFKDYNMWVESRMMNRPVIFLTVSIIVLVLFVAIIYIKNR